MAVKLVESVPMTIPEHNPPGKRLLFVCLGNIVRSPLAEALFAAETQKLGLDSRFSADSAGVSGWHVGESPDPRMLRVAAAHGVHYSHRSRQVSGRDLEHFDLVVAMDRENYADLHSLAFNQEQLDKIHMLREWDPMGGPLLSVPDPYYGGIDGFEEVYATIERSVQGLAQALSAEAFRRP
jgi:protein-tyrosine phosphatase